MLLSKQNRTIRIVQFERKTYEDPWSQLSDLFRATQNLKHNYEGII